MTTTNDLCSSLGLTDIEKIICESLEKDPLTANLLYKLFLRLEPKLPVITNGIEGIIKNNAIRIALRNAIMQQLPWLIGFFLIILTLLFTKTISIYAFGMLFIAAIVITIVITGLNLYLNMQGIEKIIRELKSKLRSNMDDFKSTIL